MDREKDGKIKRKRNQLVTVRKTRNPERYKVIIKSGTVFQEDEIPRLMRYAHTFAGTWGIERAVLVLTNDLSLMSEIQLSVRAYSRDALACALQDIRDMMQKEEMIRDIVSPA